MIRICHISDTHGWPLVGKCPEEAGIIVHSGDLLPNRTFGMREVEMSFQTYWLEENAHRIERWANGRPIIASMGNHDYVRADFVTSMSDCPGLFMFPASDRVMRQHCLGFLAFPYVPYFFGTWNLEINEREIEARFAPVVDLIEAGEVDVLILHSPIYGVLDRNGKGIRCGSKAIRKALSKCKRLPKAILHGHIHESNGLTDWRGVIVSNAATTMNMIPVSL